VLSLHLNLDNGSAETKELHVAQREERASVFSRVGEWALRPPSMLEQSCFLTFEEICTGHTMAYKVRTHCSSMKVDEDAL